MCCVGYKDLYLLTQDAFEWCARGQRGAVDMRNSGVGHCRCRYQHRDGGEGQGREQCRFMLNGGRDRGGGGREGVVCAGLSCGILSSIPFQYQRCKEISSIGERGEM